MKRRIVLCLMLTVMCVISGVANSPIDRPGSAPEPDIRKVDFLNFTYQSSRCSQEYGKKGIGKVVRVTKGEFKNRSVYFAVADNRIIYADVTGDGTEDAIVPVDCGAIGANFSRSEVNVYTFQGGRATLLAATNDKTLERDYRANYPDADSYWGISENGIKANNGNLQIEVLVDGPHAAPKYIATLEYRLSGKTLGLTGKPARKPATQ